MIDLHSHSTKSDGTLTPTALIEEAKARGLHALALTDHDSVDGLDEAQEAARHQGVVFIPGVEIEIAFEPGECHLLGLGLTGRTDELRDALASLAEGRKARNRSILELMLESGVEASYAEVEAFSGGGVVGRPHFASLLVSRKVVKNKEQAFSRYLGKGRPFFVPKLSLEFDLALRLIKESGGVAILAHPMSLYLSWGKLPDLIKEWKDAGLDGLEAWHPTAKARACERLESLGRSLGMLVTAGSDFHGGTRPDRKLGITAGGRVIDDRYMDGIPTASTS